MKYFPKLRINKIKFFYLSILGMVFAVFLILSFLNIELKKQVSISDVYLSPLSFTPQNYPLVENKYTPIISAQGAVVIDKASQVPLYEKNPRLRFSPASTAKIMTALVAIEYYKSEDILTVFKSNVEGTTLKFNQGEKLTFESLLYAMMLPSSNDATLSIAQNYPGGEEAFVVKMNEKAKSFHLIDTLYGDPIGLIDEKGYTTAIDLARLASIALQNPTFAKVVATKNMQITSLQGNKYILYNLNKLLDLPGVNGVKTGFTQGAGQVLVTSKNEGNNQDLIFVVMQSLDRFGDTQILLNYLSNNLTYLSIHP